MTLNKFEAIIQLCIRTKNYLKQWCDYAYKLKQIYSNGVIMHTKNNLQKWCHYGYQLKQISSNGAIMHWRDSNKFVEMV